MSDSAWISATITAARPKAMAALLRAFRDLDRAEEAFQEACLRALKNWPRNGPPRDAAAWLIMVGRNAGIDGVRKTARERPLPSDDMISNLDDVEPEAIARIDEADYRDDILRLLFVCCHPDLPSTQQIPLALRIVSGLSVHQIARAFLVSEAAMEQRITRAKAKVTGANVPFEAPGPAERMERLAIVAAMVYLVFNEGYTTSVAEHGVKAPMCEEAIRLGRLLLHLFPAEPEVMGLVALMLLQHARASSRFDSNGAVVLLENQSRALWDRRLITEGLALIDKAIRHQRPGPYQAQAAIAALHARAATFQTTDWSQIELLYGALERFQPSPVVTLNRAVAVSRARGPADGLAMIEPLASVLSAYFYFHGARGAFLKELGRNEEARQAFDRAIALANTPAEAAHIRAQLDSLASHSGIGEQQPSTTPVERAAE